MYYQTNEYVLKSLMALRCTSLQRMEENQQKVFKDLRDVDRQLTYYTDDLVIDTTIIRTVDDVLKRHEELCLTHHYDGGDFDVVVDERVRLDVAHMYLSEVLRGPENSSNPMSIVASVYRLQGLKAVAEAAGVLRALTDSNSVKASLREYKEQAEKVERARKAQPRCVRYVKLHGFYLLEVLNCEGEVLSIRRTNETQKPKAKAAAADLAEKLTAKHHSGTYVTVTVKE